MATTPWAQTERRSATRARIRTTVAGGGVFALVAGGLIFGAGAGAANAALPQAPVEFTVPGSVESWTVPVGVTSVDLVVNGASGGRGGGTNGGAPGVGATLSGTLAVTAGDELEVYVGEAGTDGYLLEPGDDGYDGPSDGDAGVGGQGWTEGGEGGHGSFFARSGGGGGGSSAVVVNSDEANAIVAAAGAGGGGRGVFGFCFGGDAGDAGEAGNAPRDDEALPPDPDFDLHCLGEGAGGELNFSDDGDGTNGQDVDFLLGGGGGGGGASVFGDGISGGQGGRAGSLFPAPDGNPDTPLGTTGIEDGVIGLGGGGGGGAGGGGSSTTGLENTSTGLATQGDGSVTIFYSIEYATATSIAIAPASPIFADDLTVTVTVENLTTDSLPTGTVQLMIGTDTPLTAPVVDGQAVFTLTAPYPAGTHMVSAAYLPDDISPYAPSSSETTLAIAKAPTTTTLVVDPASVRTGSSARLTATVGSATDVVPTGTVAFYRGTQHLGDATLTAAGTATLSVTTTGTGTGQITARFLGDPNFLASTSTAVSLTVTAVPAAPAALANTGFSVNDVLPLGIALLLAGAAAVGVGTYRRSRSRSRSHSNG
ncbi:Ig-like domain-containing protein [Herbiconiux sp. CPCC 205763]|uniref:Ig-like domain-containing protein n=1 Tax=Herbiconiux aconitum TaxID=2970913 RepID=A0ABT2GU94_9MICO|nr:Ig-like domain-containing protein [Herbiconiux aconitum]MCS5718875.1 Ig-like domain-containing protein [Herbiconiux aconitum]